MKPWMHKIELIVDKLIPYSLILLILVVVVEIFFYTEVVPYQPYISFIDGIIVGIFIVDLAFKYMRSRNIPEFLRKNWLDIIAVFPTFLIVRLIEEFVVIARLEDAIGISQEVIEVGERLPPGASRMRYFARFIRPIARLPRFLKAFSFYERPGKHHKIFPTEKF